MSSCFTGIIGNCSPRCAKTLWFFFLPRLFFLSIMLFFLRLTATTTARWRATPTRTSVLAPVLVWSESFFFFFFKPICFLCMKRADQFFRWMWGLSGGCGIKIEGLFWDAGVALNWHFLAKWADLLPSLAGCSAGSLLESIFCFPWETLCNPTPPASPKAGGWREEETLLLLSQHLPALSRFHSHLLPPLMF